MFPLPLNYSEIREENGKRYLFDARNYGILAANVEKLAELVKEPRAILKKYDYPDTPEWQNAIISGGAEGLQEAILQENDKQAQRLKIPRYVAAQWRKQAIADAPAEMWAEVDAFYIEFRGLSNLLLFQASEICYNKAGNCEIAAEDIKARLMAAVSLELTEEMQKEADATRGAIIMLRKLNERGIDIKTIVSEFLGNRYAPGQYPTLDNLSLISRIKQTRQKTMEQLKASDIEGFYRAGGERTSPEEGAE